MTHYCLIRENTNDDQKSSLFENTFLFIIIIETVNLSIIYTWKLFIYYKFIYLLCMF